MAAGTAVGVTGSSWQWSVQKTGDPSGFACRTSGHQMTRTTNTAIDIDIDTEESGLVVGLSRL